MAVSVASGVSTLSSYTASLTASAKARAASSAQASSQSDTSSASNSAAQARAAQTDDTKAQSLPARPTALELAVSTSFQLEQLAARGNMQAQHVLDRREAVKGLSARPEATPSLSSAPERNVPSVRSTVAGTRVNTLA